MHRRTLIYIQKRAIGTYKNIKKSYHSFHHYKVKVHFTPIPIAVTKEKRFILLTILKVEQGHLLGCGEDCEVGAS